MDWCAVHTYGVSRAIWWFLSHCSVAVTTQQHKAAYRREHLRELTVQKVRVPDCWAHSLEGKCSDCRAAVVAGTVENSHLNPQAEGKGTLGMPRSI